MASDALARLALELLAPLGGVRSRRMFGGHGIDVDGLFVAIVAFDRLYLKTSAETAPRFAAAGGAPFVHAVRGRSVALNYWSAPAEAMDSPSAMAPWGRLALQAALAARRQPRPRRARAG